MPGIATATRPPPTLFTALCRRLHFRPNDHNSVNTTVDLSAFVSKFPAAVDRLEIPKSCLRVTETGRITSMGVTISSAKIREKATTCTAYGRQTRPRAMPWTINGCKAIAHARHSLTAHLRQGS